MEIDTDSEMLDDGDDDGTEAIDIENDEFNPEEESFSIYLRNIKLGGKHGS
jgi:hypothetical protein